MKIRKMILSTVFLFSVNSFGAKISCNYTEDLNSEKLKIALNAAQIFSHERSEVLEKFKAIIEEKLDKSINEKLSGTFLLHCDVDSAGNNYSKFRKILIEEFKS